jgi:hypothetical protein
VDLYAIHRRSGFSPDEVEQADARSKAAAAERADRLRHIRSYLLEEEDGRLGTICIYQAAGPEALVEHAQAARLPCDEIVRVGATIVSNPDPEPAGQAQGQS